MMTGKHILEPIKTVLARQKPEVPGEPFKMKVFETTLPKSVGDPWRGAYSKHGFWYRLFEGTKNDYEKLVAFSYEQDQYTLNYENWEIWPRIFSDFGFIVAKNLRDEVLGGIAWLGDGHSTHLGAYFVIEDFRHSGIGRVLFNEAKKCAKTQQFTFHSMHHLSPKCDRFGFSKLDRPEIHHITLTNPSGFPELKASLPDVRVVPVSDLTDSEWSALFSYDQQMTKTDRKAFLKEWLQHSEGYSVVLFDVQDNVVGYAQSREAAGGYVRRIIVGGVYGDTDGHAELAIRAVLHKYYNPEDDFEWNPDVFAVYRRDVHFFVPSDNKQMMEILEKLKGKDGQLEEHRLRYQTVSTHPQSVDYSKVYAYSDLHSSII